MSRTKKYILYILLIASILILYIVLSHYKTSKKNDVNNKNQLIPISEIKNTTSYDDIALSSDDTIADGEVTLQDFPDRLVVENKSILLNTTLPTVGYRTLEDFLNQYMDYYWNNGQNYYAKVVEGSFEEDYNFPSFKIYVEDIDLEIECRYYVAREIYEFYSRFNPEHE